MRTVLVLQHVPYEGHGSIADYLREHDIAFDVVRLWEPYAVPDVSQYSALIIMGGPMGVYENFPSKNDEIALIKAALGTIPMLGICLGSQLIAHALGARVYPNEKDGKPAKEIGYYTVHLTSEGLANPLFKGFDPDVPVLEWHGDAFDLPSGASLLATSPLCRNQAFAYKDVYGLLFHLELTPQMVQGLAEVNRDWAHESFDLDEERLAQEARDLAPLMKTQCYRLLDNFFN
jgi:GMP synthase-like glutamine amidotransferase